MAITQQIVNSVPVTMARLEIPYGTSSLLSSMKYRKTKKLPYFARSAVVGEYRETWEHWTAWGRGLFNRSLKNEELAKGWKERRFQREQHGGRPTDKRGSH